MRKTGMFRFLTVTTAVLVAILASSASSAGEMADTIYSGGPILTIDESAPRAEAVAVKEGRILAVGALSEIEALRGDETRSFDLQGRTMLPGFIRPSGSK